MQPLFKAEYQSLGEEVKGDILTQYNLERKLSDRLRQAGKNQRLNLYQEVYDEFFKSLPRHSMVLRKKDAATRTDRAKRHASLILPFLKNTDTFMEVGAGDCGLSFEISHYAKSVIAIDVSEEITKNPNRPDNFRLVLTEGVSINVPLETVHVTFSNQVMEHLHPDDALTQLRNISKSLVKGGLYICLTPHRYLGPHDISKYFHNEPVGFHLKEYTHAELNHLFRQGGFSKIYMISGIRGRRVKLPIAAAIFVESLIQSFPHEFRRKLARLIVFRKFINAHILAVK